jgi:hypothetical protein
MAVNLGMIPINTGCCLWIKSQELYAENVIPEKWRDRLVQNELINVIYIINKII